MGCGCQDPVVFGHLCWRRDEEQRAAAEARARALRESVHAGEQLRPRPEGVFGRVLNRKEARR